MIDREIYATDGEYSLCPVIEADREYYVRLREQVNGTDTLFLNPICKDLMWDWVLTGETKYFSVIDKKGEYCGCMELQCPLSEMPEIAIDLLSHKRNIGIAKRALKLLVLKASMEHPVDSYLVRILSGNTHSRHVFEKIGAVPVGSRGSFLEDLGRDIDTIANGEDFAKVMKALAETMYEKEDKSGEQILEYHLSPEVFVK